MKTIYQQNYSKLEKIFGENWFNINHIVLKNEPYMNLHFEKLGENHFAMAHNYRQNGDLIPDPDMEIKVYPDLKMVEALTYQDFYGYQLVYDLENPNRFNVRTKKALNKFLGQWLKNIINQGFKKTA